MNDRKLVIFDLDGVIIEAEKVTYRFYQDYLKDMHDYILKDEDFYLKIGRKSADFFQDLIARDQIEGFDFEALISRKRELLSSYPNKYVTLIDGVHDLLRVLKDNGFLIALGSINERDMIDATLQYFDLEQFFDFTTAIQDLERIEPDPEVFLKCVEKLDVRHSNVVAIEDSPLGIETARNAGIKVIALASSLSHAQLSDADIVVDQLSKINPTMIDNLIESD